MVEPARTVSLTLTVTDVGVARRELAALAERLGGEVRPGTAAANAETQPRAGLVVPAAEADAALGAIRGLGTVRVDADRTTDLAPQVETAQAALDASLELERELTARIAALMPGASPPLVRTARRFMRRVPRPGTPCAPSA